MTPPDRAPEPLSAEEEAALRRAMALDVPVALPWRTAMRRLLATLDVARDSRPVGLREALAYVERQHRNGSAPEWLFEELESHLRAALATDQPASTKAGEDG